MSEENPKEKWELDEAAFNALLDALDADREAALLKYFDLRRKVEKKLHLNGSLDAETDTDTVFDRAARQISAGKQLDAKPDGYFLTIASNLLLEIYRAKRRRRIISDDDLSAHEEPSVDPYQEIAEIERRLREDIGLAEIERCKNELDAADKRIFDVYKAGTGHENTERRRLLATELGTTAANLALIVCRIGKKLEKCTRQKLRGKGY